MDMSISFPLGSSRVEIPTSEVNALIVIAVLIVMVFYVNHKIKKADYKKKPKGIVHLMEILVEGVDSFTAQIMGKSRLGFSPYIITLMLFLLLANTMGLFGFKPPTSDLNVTVTLAIISFVLIHYNKIRANGIGGYIKGYFEPVFVLFPINVIGDIALPISLSFRLFGNILSGTIIMTLVYAALGSISNLLTPVVAPALHVYFDVFSGVVQTFIFTMITMVSISMGMGLEEN